MYKVSTMIKNRNSISLSDRKCLAAEYQTMINESFEMNKDSYRDLELPWTSAATVELVGRGRFFPMGLRGKNNQEVVAAVVEEDGEVTSLLVCVKFGEEIELVEYENIVEDF